MAQSTPAAIRHIGLLSGSRSPQLEIVLSHPITPQAQLLANPDRLAIDFPGAVAAANLSLPSIHTGQIKAVRVGLFSPNPPVTRVVIDLSSPQSFQVLPVRDFTVEELVKARQMRSQYQVAYLFSTKYEAQPLFRSTVWEKLNRRFFDYHRDVSPELAAEFLHAKPVFIARSKAEWVAILEIEQPSSVASVNQKLP